MQNIKPSAQLSTAAVLPSSVVLERVLGLAAPPLVPGESEDQYASLAGRVIAGAKPRDAIEELLTRDVIDLTWEIFRGRRMKAGILKASMYLGVNSVMESLGYEDTLVSSKAWLAGDKRTKEQVTRVLNKAGLSIDNVAAAALGELTETFEPLERWLAGAEAPRNNALREIDRHRSTCAAAVRQTLDEIEDAEFRDVESSEVAAGTIS
jgi:hypothetical protein